MTETGGTPARTGIDGLDDILGGGFSRGRTFLVEGDPGTGKTTLGLQFLIEGAKRGERGLYVTLAETEEELRSTAASHGWTLPGEVVVVELVPAESLLDGESQQSLLYSSDLELGETTRAIFAAIDAHRPTRVVLDSLSEIRLLAQSSLRYRRQVLAMKHFFARRGVTVLMLDDLTAEAGDRTTHSIAHGVLRMMQDAPSYGAERRRMRVTKYRGRTFRGGFHDFVIVPGGLMVFPRLVAAEHRRDFVRERVGSGIPALDTLLGGGLDRGSATLCIGPAGTGKSLLTLQMIAAAAARGENSVLFAFDEERGLLFDRAAGMGVPLAALCESGRVAVVQVDAAELSPGEFAHLVRVHAQAPGLGVVVIDSMNGYHNAMPDERDLLLHLHELLQFLNRQGVVTLMTVAQHGLVGDMKSPVDVTYLADAVILLRYFEAFGRVRRAMSVLKKRGSAHEDTIREYRIGDGGIEVGAPLEGFQGVLRGVPVFAGGQGTLMGGGET